MTMPRTATAALAVLLSATLAAGCQQAELTATRNSLDALASRIQELEREVEASRQALAAQQESDETERATLEMQLAGLSAGLQALPEQLKALCPVEAQAAAPTAECPEPAGLERVVVAADRTLVGELEHVWIEPPGVSVTARIDTGATSSSLHADNIMTFERDGEDWVRFDMDHDDARSVTMERQILRYARVVQQADPEGSRRPVVAMRIRLGEVQGTFEFTLADRSHLENAMILGRNFLNDVTLVDVSRQFIQPRYRR